jgi:ABC-type glycerol-3-phosphate transport system permease component
MFAEGTRKRDKIRVQVRDELLMKRFVESIFGRIAFTLVVIIIFVITPLIAEGISEGLASVTFSFFYMFIFWPALIIDPINRYYFPFDAQKNPSKDNDFLPDSLAAAIIVDVLIYAVVFYFIKRYLTGRMEKRSGKLAWKKQTAKRIPLSNQ